MGQLDYALDRDRGLLRSLDVQASAQQTLHDMTNRGKPTYEAGANRPPLRIGVASEIQNFSGRVSADLEPTDRWTLTLGTDVLHTYRNATRTLRAAPPNRDPFIPPFYQTDEGEILDNLWPGVQITQEGVFVQARHQMDGLTLTGTTRLDFAQSDARHPTGPFLENAGVSEDGLAQQDAMLSGAVTATIPFTNQWSLSLGGGSVARPPGALERYSDRFPTSKSQTSAEFQGTPSLRPERSTQADVWVEGGGSQWILRLSGFARYVDDYITLESTDLSPILPLSPSTVYRYVNGEASFLGVDGKAAVSVLPALTLQASGSYLWGRDETLDEPAFGVSPPSGTLGLRWTPLVEAAVVSKPYLDGTVRLVGRQDRVASTRGEEPTDGYTTVDLKAGAHVARQVELKVGVENLFDVSYTNHLNAKNPFSGERVPEPGRVFTTNLTVRF